MTKAEAFDKAWRLAFRNDDFSLVDQIYHPDYSAPDPNTGIVVNLEDDKVIVSSVRETYMIGLTQRSAYTPRNILSQVDNRQRSAIIHC